MDITDGQLSIMTRIAQTVGAPSVVWPDGDGGQGTLPRWVMQVSGGAQITRLIDGTIQADPEVVVRVETTEGNFGRRNKELVSLLLARFQPTIRFDGLTIIRPPQVRPPLPTSNNVYSVPVIITARQYY